MVASPERSTGVANDVGKTPGDSSFWLRSFVEQRQKGRCGDQLSESSEDYAVRADGKSRDQFCGIVTKGHQGIVDTAAEGGLIGSVALERLQNELKIHGLKCKWTPKVTTAKGVGGSAKVLGVVLIPLGIGKVNGILEASVVSGDVPLLLPIKMLKVLGAVIDLPKQRMHLCGPQVEVDLHELPSGHIAVDVVNFADGQFEVPGEAGDPSEFVEKNMCVTAMLAQSSQVCNSKPAICPRHHGDGLAKPDVSHEGIDRATSDTAFASLQKRRTQREEGLAQLAGLDGQGHHTDHAGGDAGRRKGLVSTILGTTAFMLGLLQGGDHRGHLCRDDHWRSPSEAHCRARQALL